jgi:hypothetical protein
MHPKCCRVAQSFQNCDTRTSYFERKKSRQCTRKSLLILSTLQSVSLFYAYAIHEHLSNTSKQLHSPFLVKQIEYTVKE